MIDERSVSAAEQQALRYREQRKRALEAIERIDRRVVRFYEHLGGQMQDATARRRRELLEHVEACDVILELVKRRPG
jgi:hypothetical protein